MSFRLSRTTQLIAIGAAVTMLAAACSSSGSKSTTTTGSSSTPAAAATGGTSASTSGSGAATGTPILIGGSGSITNPAYSEPQLRDGLQVAVDEINANGGVNGHPLKLDFCASNYEANLELSCARKLISDKVVAVVHPSILADTSGEEYKLYQAANIPAFGGLGLSPAEENNPDSYPLGSGDVGWFSGAAKVLKSNGITNVAIYADSNPGSQYSGGLIKGTLQGLGMTSTGLFTADPKADPTFASSAAKIVQSGAKGVILTPGPVNLPGMVKALNQAGFTGKIATITALMGFNSVQALGKLANGILLSSFFAFTTDTSNPGVQKFLADMKQYAPKAIVDDTSEGAWTAVQLFAKIAETATANPLTNTAFVTALKATSTPIDLGTVAPWAVAGRTSPVPSVATQIFNPDDFYGSIINGIETTDGKGYSSAFS